MLSACATAWFTEATKQGEIRSGFYPRLVMVPAWKKDRYLTRGAAPNRHDLHALIKRVNDLRLVRGEMQLSPRLEGLLGDWALQRQKEIEGTEHEAELASFYTRLERVAMKFAGLLQLADDPTSLNISPLALTDALNLVGWLQDSLRQLFADEFTFSKDMQDRQKLLKIITNRPGILRRDLMRAAHMTVKQIDPILDTIRQDGSAVEQQKGWFLSPPSQGVTDGGVTQKVNGSFNVSL
jgi:hypothetical protein